MARLGGSNGFSDGLIVPRGWLPAAILDYIRRLRDVTYNQTIFDILAQQYELARLDQAKEGELIQVIDPAIIPDNKSLPQRGLIIMCSSAVGFLIGVFIALFADGLDCFKADDEAKAKLLYPKGTLSWRSHRVFR